LALLLGGKDCKCLRDLSAKFTQKGLNPHETERV
jgi:hypothetical protein